MVAAWRWWPGGSCPYAAQDAADAANPLDEQRLEVHEAVFCLRLPDGTIEEQVSPEMHAVRERYATYMSSQLRAAVSPEVLDATVHDPHAALLVERVMIIWSSGESAHAETGRIMMPAVADVLRVHGFTIEPHWSRSGAQVVTGRQLLPEHAAGPSAAVPGTR